MINDKIFDERILFLESVKEPHFLAAQLILENSDLRPIHYYTLTVLNRSLSLVYGFTSLVRTNNFVSAAPLVRVQIDNLLRFRAAFISNDVDAFVSEFTEGKHIRHLKDKSGNNMTDAYLRKTFSQSYDWLNELYERTSGYIHLSNVHMIHMISVEPIDEETANGYFYVGADEKFVSDEEYLEAVEAMIRVTYFLLESISDLVLKPEGRVESDK